MKPSTMLVACLYATLGTSLPAEKPVDKALKKRHDDNVVALSLRAMDLEKRDIGYFDIAFTAACVRASSPFQNLSMVSLLQ